MGYFIKLGYIFIKLRVIMLTKDFVILRTVNTSQRCLEKENKNRGNMGFAAIL